MGSFLTELWEGQEVRAALCLLPVCHVSNLDFIFISQYFSLEGTSPTNASALRENRNCLPVSCYLFFNHTKAWESHSQILGDLVCQMMAVEELVWGKSNHLCDSHTSTPCGLFLDTYILMSMEVIVSKVGGWKG